MAGLKKNGGGVGGGWGGVNGTDTSLLHGPDAQPRSTNGPTAMFYASMPIAECSKQSMTIVQRFVLGLSSSKPNSVLLASRLG